MKNDDMRAEYDLRGGVRGKYYERYRQGMNIVVLDSDLEAQAVTNDCHPESPELRSREATEQRRTAKDLKVR